MSENEYGNLRRLRIEEREELEFVARLRIGTGEGTRFVMRNVSHGGFMGDCDLPLSPGSEVTLELPALGDLAARVMWSDGNRIGCKLRHGLKFRQIFFLLLLSCREQVEREKLQSANGRGSEHRAA